MSFRPASKDFAQSHAFTNLELNGGYDCHTDYPQKAVDLLVQGGAVIRKSLCVGGNIFISDLITGDLCGNIFTEKINEKEPMEGIDVCGNLTPGIDNLYNLGSMTNKWANVIAQDVTVCGTLFANGLMNIMTGNMIDANTVCVSEYLATDEIRAKTLDGNICITDNLDMKCGEIGNLQAIRVDQVFGKSSPWNSEDDMNMRNGNAITFVEGIRIGDVNTVANVLAVAIGKTAISSGSRSTAIGIEAYSNSNRSVSIGAFARSTADYSIAIGGGVSAFLGASATYNSSIAIGRSVSSSNASSIAVGTGSISSAQQSLAIGVGAYARQNNSISIGTGANCPTGGVNNAGIAIGLGSESTEQYSVAIGKDCTVGTFNDGIGIGRDVSCSSLNGIAIGRGSKTNTGSQEIRIGYMSGGSNNISGNMNIGIGGYSLYNIQGNYNVAVGQRAGRYISTGLRNIAIGSQGGNTITTGANNVIIGSYADVTGSGGIGQTAIGHYALAAANYSVAIGHYAGTGTPGSGSFHTVLLNMAGGSAVYQTGTGELVSTTSSIRFKENVEPLESTLDKVIEMKPVRFKYKEQFSTDTSDNLGFIAEEMNNLFPEVVVKNQNGQIQSIQYPKLTSVLTKALQEAVEKINILEQRVSLLENNHA